MQATARTASGDAVAAHELYLFIENDGALYHWQYQPILKNLMTKRAKGGYDAAKAVKLWLYLVESGAKKYAKEFGGVWYEMFPVATRKLVAQELNTAFLDEAATGSLDSLLPLKYAPEWKKAALKRAKKGQASLADRGSLGSVGGGKRRQASLGRLTASVNKLVR
jgi:hypothetical protein